MNAQFQSIAGALPDPASEVAKLQSAIFQQAEQTLAQLPTVPDPTGRDPRGRFAKGCPPGPGRPSAPRTRRYIEEGMLYLHSMDFENAARAWRSLAGSLGPNLARKFLAELEDENGPLRFRGLALEAITEGN